MKIVVRDEGDRVLIAIGDRVFVELEAANALEFAEAMRTKALLAQERTKPVREQLIFDTALLLRTGIPISLANDRRITAAAKIEASQNRDLRRALPSSEALQSIPSAESVGSPRIIL